jgi:hypothetical protein
MKAVSTLVAVIGENALDVARRVAAGSVNVGLEATVDQPEGLAARAKSLQEVWMRARHHGLIYTLVNSDPLRPVVDEWANRLLGEDHELELAIAAVGKPELPDYYLVDEHLPTPQVDWYLANLHSLAPTRVLPVKMEPGPLAARLAALPFGRPFPSGDAVASSARHFVPLPELVVIEH